MDGWMDGGKEGRNPVSGGGCCELQMSHTPFRTSFSSITVDVVGMELRVKERKEGRERESRELSRRRNKVIKEKRKGV